MTDFQDGDYIRFRHHDGTRAGGPAKPIFRLRPALRFEDGPAGVRLPVYRGLERVTVVPFPPYAKGSTHEFPDEMRDQFVKTEMPVKKAPARTTRQKRGTR